MSMFDGLGDSIGSYFNRPFTSPVSADGKPAQSSMTGMTPEAFGSIAGQLASAIGKEGSWQNSVGKVGSAMNQQTILAKANQANQDKQFELMKMLLHATPPKVQPNELKLTLPAPQLSAPMNFSTPSQVPANTSLLDQVPGLNNLFAPAFKLGG